MPETLVLMEPPPEPVDDPISLDTKLAEELLRHGYDHKFPYSNFFRAQITAAISGVMDVVAAEQCTSAFFCGWSPLHCASLSPIPCFMFRISCDQEAPDYMTTVNHTYHRRCSHRLPSDFSMSTISWQCFGGRGRHLCTGLGSEAQTWGKCDISVP